tara:strand:+ start:1382 stop:2014 length:633 start_codon:yes stop_codon:yes gene_type:complete
MIIFSASLSFFTSQSVKAEGCSDYPYVAMETKFIPQGDGLFSLQVTQEASVRADSQSQKIRALKIAQLKGEQAISKFIKQELEGKESFSSASVENVVQNPNGEDWEIEEAIELFESVSASSKNLIRGIVPLGSCYEPGKYVRVTIGIKPETIMAAGNAEATSNKPFSGYNSTANSSNPSDTNSEEDNDFLGKTMQPFNTAPGYSGINTDF